ncbi:MAG TPA: DUF1552 domain-containing protein [Polyangium sp.]|nr:DUF1552 domain-containing protein [Polyangium sp.]
MNRRHFLRGLFGVSLSLPFLEGLSPRKAEAGPGDIPPFAIFMRQANGVVQQTNDEPEMFWPSAVGAITTESLNAESDRTVSELSAYASRMILLKGINFGFPGNGCGHSGGGNQCLTAARVSDVPAGNESLAMGESIDNRIARELNPPGVEPLTLYSGKKSGYINEVLSYRGPKDIRSAEHNPITAYNKLFGLADLDPEVLKRLASERKSVNDLVRSQMQTLLSRNDLSSNDRKRLDLHFQSIRDLEITLSCKLTPDEVAAMEAMSPDAQLNDNIEAVARMQMDIIALAMACGTTRAATLQIGDGNDSTQYTIDGVKQKSYHRISHRIDGDGDVGDPIVGAVDLHHKIDRIHARLFRYLCDKLAAYDLGSGSLLDFGVAVWLNDLSNKYHSYSDVPYVLVGSASGYLKTGQYLDAGGVNNNKLLSTIGAACGCKNGSGSPLDDFGDPTLEKGQIAGILA